MSIFDDCKIVHRVQEKRWTRVTEANILYVQSSGCEQCRINLRNSLVHMPMDVDKNSISEAHLQAILWLNKCKLKELSG